MVVERIAEKMVVEKHVKEYVYRSKLPDIEIPYHLPLHTYCFQHFDSYRHKPCIIHGSTGDVYTYGEVELATRRVAAGLHRLGIKRGEVVMILLPNSPEFAFSFLGASYRGAISTTANPLYTPSEIAKQAGAAGARLVITMVCYVEKVREMATEREMKVVTIDKPAPPWCLLLSELTGDDELPAPEVEISPDDVVTLPFSSGTTGLPKGVLLTHKGQVTNVAQLVDGDNPNLHYRRDDVLLCVLPMYHIYCLSSVLVGGMRAGATLVVMQRFEIRAMMELVQKHRVTVVPIVPPIVLAIAKTPLVDNYDLSSIRTVICGAAPMGRELEDALRVKLPNVQLGQVLFFLCFHLITSNFYLECIRVVHN